MVTAMTTAAFAQPAAKESPAAMGPLLREMVEVTKPASDTIFDVGRAAPTRDEDWTSMARAGVLLVESGNRLLSLAPQARDRGTWMKLSRQMAADGQTTKKAAETRNLRSLTRASERLVVVCETCHAKYRNQILE